MKRDPRALAPPRQAETAYVSALQRLVHRWQAEVFAALGLDARTDASLWKLRILYGTVWANESFASAEEAEERARQIRAKGYPVEVFGPGPIPAWFDPAASKRVLETLDVRIGRGLTEDFVARMVDPITKRVGQANLRKLGAAMSLDSARSDPAVRDHLTQFRKANAELIRTLPKRAIAELQPLIAQAHAEGWRVEKLREVLIERFDVERSHAQLIARDQILKLNGQITKTRQQAAGIRAYVWTTSKDERVRPEHKRLDGKTFSWDDPPEVAPGRREHPGGDFQCRCTPFPVLDSVAALG